MHASHELSRSVRTRRQEIGLSQKALAALSGLSRSTVSQIEAGTLKDLSLTRTAAVLEVLGLGLTIAPAHPRIRDASVGSKPLDLAARTASVSYAEMLPPGTLGEAFRSGTAPAEFTPHIGTLLEEAPLPMLAKVVEQVHADFDVPRKVVWANMRRIAAEQQVIREIWNA